MANRPFIANNRNIFNETVYTAAPATIGSTNVIVSQALNRNILDQNCMSITGNPQSCISSTCSCPCKTLMPPSQAIPGHSEYIPGGVSFTFNPMAQNYALQGFQPPTNANYTNQQHPNQYLRPTNANYTNQQQPSQYNPFGQSCPCQSQNIQQTYQQPLTLEQQIALKQLERQHLELVLLQEQLKKNPYKLQFHYNGQTSTTDLLAAQAHRVPPSHETSDFMNINSGMANLRNEIEQIGKTDKLPPDCPPTSLYPPVSKAKMLLLTKSPDIQRAKVQDDSTSVDQTCFVDQANQTKASRRKCKNKAKQSKKPESDKNSSSGSSCSTCRSKSSSDSTDN